MDFAIPTIFIVIVYFMGGLRYSASAFFANYATCLLAMLVAQVCAVCASLPAPAHGSVCCSTSLTCLLCVPLRSFQSIGLLLGSIAMNPKSAQTIASIVGCVCVCM